MSNKIYIGVGHGGTDPGAVANGIREADINLDVAFKCQASLQRCGFDTKISRTSDVTFPTASKIIDANNWGADYVFDVHHNAGGGEGWEIYRAQAGGASKDFAELISDYISEIGRKNRGAKTRLSGSVDYFGIIRETKAPANLIEFGFVDNVADVKYIVQEQNQKDMAEAVTQGICEALNVPYIAEGTAAYIKVQLGAFKSEQNARRYLEQVKETGLDAFLIMPDGDGFYRVQVGAFLNEDNARAYMYHMVQLGFTDAFITTK